jgi:hypothetical protein
MSFLVKNYIKDTVMKLRMQINIEMVIRYIRMRIKT